MSLIKTINNKIPKRFKRAVERLLGGVIYFFYETDFLHGRDIVSYCITKRQFRRYPASKRGGMNSLMPPQTLPMIIYTADGKSKSNGLADRFRSMVLLYSMCKKLNIGFKIYFTSPVDLQKYLAPNEHDWVINADEMIYDVKRSVVCRFRAGISQERVFRFMPHFADKYSQIHIPVYLPIGTDQIDPNEYTALFNKLFKPTEELKDLIDTHLSNIGGDFISVTFRFQQLLGDFVDKGFPVLPYAEQIDLMDRCVEHLYEIYKENKDIKKIFVTSDSETFINRVKDIDFVYAIPGKVAHIDFEQGLDYKVYMKCFLDYFMLTYSKCIYQVIDGAMYQSQYPVTAAYHTGKPINVRRY